MFSVFIAHHPDDYAAAADLAYHLDSSGAVSRLGKTAEDAWNRGYSSDYIAIIWSASSLSSPYLYEIAAVETDYRLLHLKLGMLK